MTRKERLAALIPKFRAENPAPRTELEYHDPFQLLVAVILSAQCTDERVNRITPALFRKFPDACSMSKAAAEEVFGLIRSCSYPNSKTRYLIESSAIIQREYGGIIPSDAALLQKLPGVGRKTAHVIASVVFGQPRLAVDTHVFRVAARLGLTKNARTPLKAEKQLTAICPEEDIPDLHHYLILHGRYICTARKPACTKCPVHGLCPFSNKTA